MFNIGKMLAVDKLRLYYLNMPNAKPRSDVQLGIYIYIYIYIAIVVTMSQAGSYAAHCNIQLCISRTQGLKLKRWPLT